MPNEQVYPVISADKLYDLVSGYNTDNLDSSALQFCEQHNVNEKQLEQAGIQLYYNRNDLAGALAFFRFQERIFRERENAEGLNRALINQKTILVNNILASFNSGNIKTTIELLHICDETVRMIGNSDAAARFTEMRWAILNDYYFSFDLKQDWGNLLHVVCEIEKILPDNPDSEDYRTLMKNKIWILFKLASAGSEKMEWEKADENFRELISISNAINGKDHPETINYAFEYGLMLNDSGNYQRALPYYLAMLKYREENLPPDSWEIASIHTNLAVLYRNLGRYEESEPLNERALALYIKVMGKDTPRTANAATNLAMLKFLMNKDSEAVCLCREYLDAQHGLIINDPPLKIPQLRKLAVCYRFLALKGDLPEKKYEDAAHHLELSLKYFRMINDDANAEETLRHRQEISGLVPVKFDKQGLKIL